MTGPGLCISKHTQVFGAFCPIAAQFLGFDCD